MVGNSVARSNTIDEETYTSRSTSLVERGPEDGVVEAVVHLEQRVRELVEVRDPAHDRGQVDHVRAAAHGCARLVREQQVAGVDLAGLPHPGGRLALVGDPHLEAAVGEQAAHDRRADRAGAAGDEHPAHVSRGMRAAARARGTAAARERRRAPTPSRSTGRRAARRRAARPAGPRSSEWLVAITTASAPSSAASSGSELGRHVRVVARDVGELALEQPDELVRERVAQVVGVALEGEARARRPCGRAATAEPRLEPLDEEQRHGLVHARDGQQHAGRAGALLREGEVLAQAGAGRQARAWRSRRAGSRG